MDPFFSRDGCTIYHGDCREVLPTLPAESVDMIVADCPYVVEYRGKNFELEPIVGDTDAEWLRPAFAEVWRIMKPDTVCVAFYGWPHSELFVQTWKEIGFRLVSHIAFVKNVWGLGRMTRGQHETAFLLAKGRPPRPATAVSDVIEWQRERDAFHPNQKPVASLVPLIRAFAPEEGTVLDPFMGSGSTLCAAKSCGCDAVGVEVELDYCVRAARRLNQPELFPRVPRAGTQASLFFDAGVPREDERGEDTP